MAVVNLVLSNQSTHIQASQEELNPLARRPLGVPLNDLNATF